MKPKYNTAKLRSQAFGASLVTAITFCIAGQATAQWTGTTSTNWATATNWTGNVVPSGAAAATVNIATPVATVTTAVPNVNNIQVGNGASPITGQLDIAPGGSLATTGAGQFNVSIGRAGGTGTQNVTGGSFICNGEYFVGVNPASIGTLNQSAGTITSQHWTVFGRTGGNGTFNQTSGTFIQNNDPIIIGSEDGALGSIGAFTQSVGATLTANRLWVASGNSAGTVTSSGVVTSAGLMIVGNGGAGSYTLGTVGAPGVGSLNVTTGETWVGQGSQTSTFTMNNGSMTINNWLAVGRQGGTGTFNLVGGTLTKNGLAGDITVGAGTNGATDGIGTFNMSGGILNCASDLQICEDGSRGTSVFNITGGSMTFRQIQPGSTSSVGGAGILNANGGTITTGGIVGNGSVNKVANFNGSQIIASGNSAIFISGLNTADVQAGGLKVDSQAFNITASALLSGVGGVTKTGSGVLTLTGNNTFSGLSTVNAGKLNITAPTGALGFGNYVVNAGTTLGVTQNPAETARIGSLFVGGSSGPANLEFNLNAIPTAPGIAGLPALETSQINLNGLVNVKVLLTTPALGYYPLFKVNAATNVNPGGSFASAPIMPPGVTANYDYSQFNNVTQTGTVGINITSISAFTWRGTTDNNWINAGPSNWINAASTSTAYANAGNPAVFFDDDTSVVSANNSINLTGTVTPSSVSFGTGATPVATSYTIGSTSGGSIGGTGGITKNGVYEVIINALANGYTGINSYLGGTLTASGGVIGNAGVAGPIGTNASIGTFGGGTFNYTGPTATTDRTLSVSNAALLNSVSSGLNTTNDLTITGAVTASNGRMTKGGAGILKLTNSGNTISRGGFTVAAGTLTLDDGAGTNINSNFGDFRILGGASANIVSTNFSNLGASGGGNPAITGTTILGDTTSNLANMAITGGSVYTNSSQFLLGFLPPATPGSTPQGNLLLDSSTLNVGTYMSVGTDGNGTATVQGSSVLTVGSDFNVSDNPGSIGIMTVTGTSAITAGQTFIGKNPGSNGTLNFAGGTLTTNFTTVGQTAGATAPLNASGVVNQTGGAITTGTGGADTYIGDNGTGIWNISGASSTLIAGGVLRIGGGALASGILNVSGGTVTANLGVVVANSGTAVGTINLNTGGTLETLNVAEGAGGTSALNFDGGKLRAAVGSTVLIGAIDNVLIKAGGANVEVQGADVTTIAGSIGEVGLNQNLVKSGTGTLLMNGTSGYTGFTTVNAGTLGGSGSLFSDIIVNAGATLKPGVATGTVLTAQNVTLNSGATFSATLDTAISTSANAALALNLGGSALVVTGTPTPGTTYVIATYGSLTGTFASPPAGYTVNYAYVVTPASGPTPAQLGVAITANSIVVSAYDTWMAGFPTITAAADKLPTADPDGDGVLNSVEFALDGNPASGSQGAKVFNVLADTADVGTLREEIITIAVRKPSAGSVTFTGSPSPSAVADLYTYSIQGSTTLTTFAIPVTEVTPVVAPSGGLPALSSANYEYRSFTLGSSDGLPNKGFMRVKIEN
jgi:autotransporter-associated beta strand protein